MESIEIYRRLAVIFRDVFDDKAMALRPELTADSVREWDSLNHIRLVLAIEKAFQVRFAASEIGRLRNVGDFVELIQSKAQ